MVVLSTVLSGTLVFVIGQWILQFVIIPVQETRKTIAAIAHARVDLAEATSNPGVLPRDVLDAASRQFRKLSADLQSHLFLVRPYDQLSRIFKLPAYDRVLRASGMLIGLANGVYDQKWIEANAKKWDAICDALGVSVELGDRYPTE